VRGAVRRRSRSAWWLDRYSDEELGDLALGLGVEEASAVNVATWRSMLGNGRGRRRHAAVTVC
jgi:hypothetical protein